MGLKEYHSKRKFNQTSEPASFKKRKSATLNFCIQKHDASHLHYDLRLEYRGVLLSWAIPKGPSLNPKDKRLAIQTEDHPLDYQYFEGVIPKGNYGAGTVEIWDHGVFTTPQTTDSKKIEESLTEGLKKGHFSFILHGEKLNGEFILQKLKKDASDHAWLLIKKPDSFQESNRTIPTKKKASAKMPDFISPMLATLVDAPFDDDEWLFEIKWDGFRSLAFINEKKVRLKSRNNLLFNQKFPTIVKELMKIKATVVFDGEIVAVDKQGKSHFQYIQNYKEEKTTLCYYVFDLLYKDGEDLTDLPLIERKKILKKVLSQLNLPLIRFSDHIIKEGKAFFKLAVKKKLEGIIGKKISSTYQSRRSKDWVKIKSHLRQEVIICGFTEPKGSRKKIGALIAGIYNQNKELNYAGHVGGGFTYALLEEMYDKLKPLIIKKCPFKEKPSVNSPVTWVKPKLLAEVSFAEWTKDKIMRQPIFQGLREDKNPKSIKQEVPEHVPDQVSLTHLDKIYWPKEKITKGDLVAYYKEIAPMILPYLKNRPMMLHRFPDGIEGKDFYQKDISFNPPDGIKLFPLEQEGEINHYLLINDLKSLLYAVNLGSIDLHPFLAEITNLENPDYCIIDLDPHGISFDKVIEAALAIHEILSEVNVNHYCKTSGGKGLHIMIPFHGKYNFTQSRQFAEIIASIIQKKFPKFTSMERSPGKRAKKLYLDCLQNRIFQSIVAPYSVRPRPGATVSTPLSWDEVNARLDISKFNIKTVPARLNKMGDILKPILKGGVDLKKAIKALSAYVN